MKMRKVAIVVLIVSLVCPAYAGSDSDTVVDLVNKAVEMFQAKGKDGALAYVNSTMGPLRKGALYVFATDFKVRCWAIRFQRTCEATMHGNYRTRKENSSFRSS